MKHCMNQVRQQGCMVGFSNLKLITNQYCSSFYKDCAVILISWDEGQSQGKGRLINVIGHKQVNTLHNSLNVCIPPKIHILKNLVPYVIALGGGSLGGDDMIHASIKRDPRALQHPPCHVRAQQKDSCLWSRKRALTRHRIYQQLGLGLSELQK